MAWYSKGNLLKYADKALYAVPFLGQVKAGWDVIKKGTPSVDTKEISAYGDQLRSVSPPDTGAASPGVLSDANQALIRQYQDAIAGKAPSVAQQMLTKRTGQNTANALGNAALGTSGANSTLALREARQNASAANQDAAGAGALLRAQEIQGSQTGLGNVLGANMSATGQEEQIANQQRALALQALLGEGDINQKNAAARAAYIAGMTNATVQGGSMLLGGGKGA